MAPMTCADMLHGQHFCQSFCTALCTACTPPQSIQGVQLCMVTCAHLLGCCTRRDLHNLVRRLHDNGAGSRGKEGMQTQGQATFPTNFKPSVATGVLSQARCGEKARLRQRPWPARCVSSCKIGRPRSFTPSSKRPSAFRQGWATCFCPASTAGISKCMQPSMRVQTGDPNYVTTRDYCTHHLRYHKFLEAKQSEVDELYTA